MKACCHWSKAAIEGGRLRWWENQQAWVDQAGPVRESTATAVARHHSGAHPTLHDGEPYQWLDCPHCGRELPRP